VEAPVGGAAEGRPGAGRMTVRPGRRTWVRPGWPPVIAARGQGDSEAPW